SEQFSSLDEDLGKLVEESQPVFLDYLVKGYGEEKVFSPRDDLIGQLPLNINVRSFLSVFDELEENYHFLKKCKKPIREGLIRVAKGIKKGEPTSLYILNSFFYFISFNYKHFKNLPPETREMVLSKLNDDIIQGVPFIRKDSPITELPPPPLRFNNLDKLILDVFELVETYHSNQERLRAFLGLENSFEVHLITKKFEESCKLRYGNNKEKTNRMVERIIDYASKMTGNDLKGTKILAEIYLEWYSDFRKSNLSVANEILDGLNEVGGDRRSVFENVAYNFRIQFRSLYDLERRGICSLRELLELVKLELKNDKSIEHIIRIFKLIKEGEHQNLEEVSECGELNLKLKRYGYQVIKKISPGTHKAVYLAEDRLGTRCALKRMVESQRLELTLNKRGMTLDKMLEKDTRVSPFRLKHENISSAMPLYVDDEIFILEELYDRTLEDEIKRMHAGTSLAPFVDTPEIFNGSTILFPYPKRIFDIMYQIAVAVEESHRLGIIHGDIKPTNVGVKEDNTIVLSDFGISTVLANMKRAYPTKDFLGSVYSMDIKLFAPGKKPNRQSDLWAVGVLYYQLLTGRYPFSRDGETKEEYEAYVEELISQNQWKEVLAENIERYIPKQMEKRYMKTYPSDGIKKIIKICFRIGQIGYNAPLLRQRVEKLRD
ncbi:protein kinase, partial [Candidatus Woesearchaeota archaeon]|nr:protein kinase [Candidatus Woesearchaeota archaeon]